MAANSKTFRKKLMGLSKPQLIRICGNYKLAKYGSKNDLIDRIVTYNNSNNGRVALPINKKAKSLKEINTSTKKIKEYMQDPRTEHTMIIQHWLRKLFKPSNVSFHDVIYIITSYTRPVYKVMKWSSKYICRLNEELFLSDNNRCCTRKRVVERTYRWVLPDMDTVKEGIHCWRVHTINPKKGWVAYAVSKKQKFRSGTHGAYGQDTVHGIAYNNCFYYSRGVIHNKVCLDIRQTEIEVDILLDLEENKLKFCVVGDLKHQTIFDNIPQYEEGWVCHFNYGWTANKIALRIVEIPSDWFGVKKSIDYEERFK
eukprot:504632_1